MEPEIHFLSGFNPLTTIRMIKKTAFERKSNTDKYWNFKLLGDVKECMDATLVPKGIVWPSKCHEITDDTQNS